NGLIRPQNGGVWFRDRPVHEIGTAGMGRVLGLVFQNPDHMLFAATVREEAAFGPRNHGFSEGEIDRRVASALETVGLTGREDLDPFIMTKGDRQKLAVASILASEPEVLVLDEPTTGLDAKEQAAMMDLLARLNQAGHTIIIITHSVRIAARYARRVVLLENGRVLAEGPARDVFARTDLLERTGLEAPPAVRLGLRFGLKTLDAAELEAALTRSGS
ncbi:MAG: ATP-binding cassette domain-containing protein, partial [Proteobacteria bacterium]|nr:ATP-binding cassette domain-containing protein [Pseudomonadota bacterium]